MAAVPAMAAGRKNQMDLSTAGLATEAALLSRRASRITSAARGRTAARIRANLGSASSTTAPMVTRARTAAFAHLDNASTRCRATMVTRARGTCSTKAHAISMRLHTRHRAALLAIATWARAARGAGTFHQRHASPHAHRVNRVMIWAIASSYTTLMTFGPHAIVNHAVPSNSNSAQLVAGTSAIIVRSSRRKRE